MLIWFCEEKTFPIYLFRVKMVPITSHREHKRKNLNCFRFFQTCAGRKYVFSAKKTTEAGSRKFRFDENEIICDHISVHNACRSMFRLARYKMKEVLTPPFHYALILSHILLTPVDKTLKTLTNIMDLL
jgi:hypothetical protein